MNSVPPRLTVMVVTFNQEKYIRQAIESILIQEFNEPYEIVVADDGSTDNTRELISELLADVSSEVAVQYLDHDINLGITRNYQRAFKACKGEYVAVLEGDDYWVHPAKLQTQMAFLDVHRECSAVSTNYFTFDEKTSRFRINNEIGLGFCYLGAPDLIQKNVIGNFSTCVYRLSALRAIPEALYDKAAYDWGVNICIARNALIGFLHMPCSVYRIHGNGTWNRLTTREQMIAQLESIEHYNHVTNKVFEAEFHSLARRLRRSVGSVRFERPILNRIGAILLACLPPVIVVCGGWFFRGISKVLLPPIVSIAIGKIRRYLK